VTRNAELVSLSVSEVGTVVVLVILGPQAGRAFRDAAMSKRDLVRTVDQRAILSQEGDHLAVSLTMRRPVVRLANEKQWARPTGALPSSPWATAIAEPGIISKTGHERAIELKRSLEIADPYKDMREQ
jgi:formylmethanofuran dehydrogenase subunit D